MLRDRLVGLLILFIIILVTITVILLDQQSINDDISYMSKVKVE